MPEMLSGIFSFQTIFLIFSNFKKICYNIFNFYFGIVYVYDTPMDFFMHIHESDTLMGDRAKTASPLYCDSSMVKGTL